MGKSINDSPHQRIRSVSNSYLISRGHVLAGAVADGDGQAGELHETLRLALVRPLLDLHVSHLELLLGGQVGEQPHVVVALLRKRGLFGE